MPRRYLAAALIACPLSACLVSYCIGCGRGPRVETTRNQQQAWWQDRLSEHVRSLTPVDGKARFISDGFFVSGDPSRQVSQFVVGEGESFRTRPDRHASAELRVKKIQPEGVTVEYESRFDHRSFGKLLITIDCGSVLLPWKATAASQAGEK